MDLDMLAAIAKQSPAKNQEDSRRIANCPQDLEFFPGRYSGVTGAAFAGGCGVATLCDFTLAVPEAKFGYTEVKIGFLRRSFPCSDEADRRKALPIYCSRAASRSGRRKNSLVSEVVPADRLMARARELRTC